MRTVEPGKVVIILAGRFRGRRAVVLKQLASGLLLVSGPMKVNGVPLRRVHPKRAIVTSTTVDVSKVGVASICDKLFAQSAADRKIRNSQGFFVYPQKVEKISAAKKAVQQKVDAALSKALDKDMSAYLKARFSLSNNDRFHEMNF